MWGARDDAEPPSSPHRRFFRRPRPGIHHRGGRQRRRRHHYLLASRRAVGLPAFVDAAPHHGGPHHDAGDVLAHGRGDGQRPIGPYPRRVRAAHHVFHHGPAAAGEPGEHHGQLRRYRRGPRAVSHFAI